MARRWGLVGGLALACALAAPVEARDLPLLRSGGGQVGSAGCAWPFLVTSETLNLAYPDPSSTYWAALIALGEGDALSLRGSYPSARFMAVTLYDLAGNILEQLTDYEIEPEPGSANPFAVADPPPGSGRSWQIRVVPAQSGAGGPNLMRLDAGDVGGWLVYRVYLGNPAGDLTGGAPLPTIDRYRDGRLLESRAPCTTFLPGTQIANLVARTMPEPVLVTAAPEMVRIANDGGLFVNAANAYLSGFADAAPERILVVRGKLPTTPNTGAGQSVVGDFDMRYFSITSNLNQKPYPVVAGLYDAELPLDEQGFYTVVIAQDGEGPTNAVAANGVAVLSWGGGPSETVIVRNMLPASDFAPTVQDVTPSVYGQPSDAAAVMGEFYPAIVECTRAEFEATGAPGCFAAAGVAYPGT